MDGKNVIVTTSKAIIPLRPCAAIPILVSSNEMQVPVRQNNSLFYFTKIFQYSFILLLLITSTAFSQRQLIVLKNEEVLARYQKGDVIHFSRAQDKEIQIQRILDLNDTLLMMNMDSVAYYRIKKLDLRERKQTTYSQKLGAIMMVAGVMLPLAELLNTGVIQNENASVSSGVWATSATLIGVGAALVFIKKPYFKPSRKHRLIIVDNRSPFYKTKPVAEGYLSPYIPK